MAGVAIFRRQEGAGWIDHGPQTQMPNQVGRPAAGGRSGPGRRPNFLRLHDAQIPSLQHPAIQRVCAERLALPRPSNELETSAGAQHGLSAASQGQSSGVPGFRPHIQTTATKEFCAAAGSNFSLIKLTNLLNLKMFRLN